MQTQATGSDPKSCGRDHLKNPAEILEERLYVATEFLKSNELEICNEERPFEEKLGRATSALKRGLG